MCLLYVRIRVEPQTFSASVLVSHLLLLELSTGLLTFAEFGHKDNVDAKVRSLLFLYCMNHSIISNEIGDQIF